MAAARLDLHGAYLMHGKKERKKERKKESTDRPSAAGNNTQVLEFNIQGATGPQPTFCGHLGRETVVRRTGNDQQNNSFSTLQWDIGISGVQSCLSTLFYPI